MRHFFKILIVPFLVLFLCAGSALAITIDGVMGNDWDVANYTSEDAYGAYQVNPGYGGQSFDVEKIGLYSDGTTLFFGLQTGFDFLNGVTYEGVPYYAGDIFIDFGNDGWDIAINISDSFGDIINVNSLEPFPGASYPISAPYKADGDKIGSISSTYSTATYNNDLNEETYGIEGSLALSLLSDEMKEAYNSGGATIHWTMSCGNDALDHTATAPVPEPATMLLLGTGLVGLAGVSRKKFKK